MKTLRHKLIPDNMFITRRRHALNWQDKYMPEIRQITQQEVEFVITSELKKYRRIQNLTSNSSFRTK